MTRDKIQKVVEQLKQGRKDFAKIAEETGASLGTVRVQNYKLRKAAKKTDEKPEEKTE